MQNCTVKSLYNLDWFTPTAILHRNLTLLTVKDMFMLQLAKFVHKQRNESLPQVFNNYYTINSQVYRYSTRQSNLLHSKKHKSANLAKTLKVAGTKLYNSLPWYITDSPSLNTFKNRLQKHLSSLY